MLLSSAQEHCKENFGDDPGCCGFSGGLFLREEMVVGTLVCFLVACLAFSEKNMLQCLLEPEI